jgi:hypothetical protein
MQASYPQAAIKDVQATTKTYSTQKRTSSTSKHEIPSLFFYFCGSVLFSLGICIRIRNIDFFLSQFFNIYKRFASFFSFAIAFYVIFPDCTLDEYYIIRTSLTPLMEGGVAPPPSNLASHLTSLLPSSPWTTQTPVSASE